MSLKDLVVETATMKERYSEMLKEKQDLATEEHELTKKQFNALVRIYMKDSRQQTEEELSEVMDKYDELFGK